MRKSWESHECQEKVMRKSTLIQLQTLQKCLFLSVQWNGHSVSHLHKTMAFLSGKSHGKQFPESCQKTFRIYQKVSRKLPKIFQKVSRKFLESFQKIARNSQKAARNLSESLQKFFRKWSESCQKVFGNSSKSCQKVARKLQEIC